MTKEIPPEITDVMEKLMHFLKDLTDEEWTAIPVMQDEPIIQESDLPRRKRVKVPKDRKKKVPTRRPK